MAPEKVYYKFTLEIYKCFDQKFLPCTAKKNNLLPLIIPLRWTKHPQGNIPYWFIDQPPVGGLVFFAENPFQSTGLSDYYTVFRIPLEVIKILLSPCKICQYFCIIFSIGLDIKEYLVTTGILVNVSLGALETNSYCISMFSNNFSF
ncbi:hypothetical protein FKM82_006331 [Ascaphus truei]